MPPAVPVGDVGLPMLVEYFGFISWDEKYFPRPAGGSMSFGLGV